MHYRALPYLGGKRMKNKINVACLVDDDVFYKIRFVNKVEARRSGKSGSLICEGI